MWCAFSPIIRGRAFLAEAAPSLEACRDPAAAFHPGQAVKVGRFSSSVYAAAQAHKTRVSLRMAGGARVPELRQEIVWSGE